MARKPVHLRSRTRASFYLPLVRWHAELRRRGYAIRWSDQTSLPTGGADYVLLDQRAFSQMGLSEFSEFAANWRKRTANLIWLDSSDSTGTTRFEILPLVDRYLKRHLLREPSWYQSQMRGRRFHEQEFERKLSSQVLEPPTMEPPQTPLPAKAFPKVGLLWTFAYLDFSVASRFSEVRSLVKRGFPDRPLYGGSKPLHVAAPFSSGHPGATGVARRLALDVANAAGWGGAGANLTLRSYRRLLALSRILVSPFGLGEYCLRDFEASWFGACLAKPSVEHIATFPSILKPGITYIPLSWDPQKWPEEVEQLTHAQIDTVANGLAEWARALSSPTVRDQFLDHLVECALNAGWCGRCERGWWSD